MARQHRLLLIAVLLVVATGGTSVARPATSTCPQVTDPRGDVVFHDEVDESNYKVSSDRAAGWSETSLDILSVRVSADNRNVTTTVHVAGLTDDPVHGYVWRVWLEPDTSHSRERLETLARRVSGGDTFAVHYEYWDGRGPGVGPVGSTTGHTEDVPTTGSIDVARGLIQVQIPLALLDGWHIKSARIWGLQAQSNSAAGVVAGPLDWGNMYEGGASDDALLGKPRGRLNAPGC